ncbi:hypothetical protein ACQU0X_26605 [Pseudovibrio ascidiaceicola]|uniref:hypothetical protein n=1 Tax=Pseudovibrio ascidiaceicola TaxID=285279 RepID=UPI003D35C069
MTTQNLAEAPTNIVLLTISQPLRPPNFSVHPNHQEAESAAWEHMAKIKKTTRDALEDQFQSLQLAASRCRPTQIIVFSEFQMTAVFDLNEAQPLAPAQQKEIQPEASDYTW